MTELVETAIYRLQVEGDDKIKALTASIKDMATAEQDATKSNSSLTQQIQRSLTAMDPLLRVQAQYTKALELNARARESGAASATELDAHLAGINQNYQRSVSAIQAYEKATGAAANTTKVARYEMINLGRQAQDVVVSLGSGQNILMVGLQQGSQILDVFLSSERKAADIFKDFGATIGRFLINPITIAVGAVGALAVAVVGLANSWDKAQVSSQRALEGRGATTGTTITDLNAFVQRSSGVSGTRLSGAEARELANAFAATGKIVVSQLDDMSNAVVGFANKTGKSTKDVRDLMVQFATDPVKGLEEMEKVWGDVDVATRDAVKSMSDARNVTGAFNLIIRTFADESEKAAKNMSAVDKATRLLFSTREIGFKPTGQESQLEAAAAKLNAALNQPPVRTGSAADDAAFAERAAEAVKELNAEYEKQFAAQQKLINQQMKLQFNEIAKAAETVSEAILPQIAQIKRLTTQIEALEIAKSKGALSPQGEAALVVGKGQKEDLEQGLETTRRITEETNRIADAHKDVSRSVAVTLDGLEKQRALAEAVGGAEKLAAQYAIDYADAKKAGATASEAATIASEKQAVAQAAINASAKETLWNLQNQAAAAGAVTGAEEMAADAAATYNKMVHDGVEPALASAAAAQQLANAQAKATANVLRQVEALKDSTRMIEAQADGTEDVTAAAIAYKNAIQSGADATAAAALRAATLANYAARAEASSWNMAKAWNVVSSEVVKAGQYLHALTDLQNAPQAQTFGLDYATKIMKAWEGTSGGSIPLVLTPKGYYAANDATSFMLAYDQQTNPDKYDASGQLKPPPPLTGSALVDSYLQAGGIDSAIAQLQASATPDLSSISSLYDLKNQGADKGTQAANLQQELAWLQSQPETLARDQSIAQLKSSIDSLITSTDSLNATNQDLLSPYYTQDPRTSHIGFRSQGMASGGYVDVPGGSSANDNLMAMIPVASGERIYVDPMSGRRGSASGGMVINISSPITINGNANADQFGRTIFQANQQLAKSVRAAT